MLIKIAERVVGAALAVVVAGTQSAQAAETVITAPEAGFRLTIPDVGWAHEEQRDSDGGLTAIALGPPAEGGLVQLSVQVTPATDESPEAVQEQVDQLRAAIAVDDSISDIRDLQIELDGHPAHGLSVAQAAFDTTFRADVVFLRARIQYRIQFHAPREKFDDHKKTADLVLAGFELIELDSAAEERLRLQRLAGRCGSLIDWATDWEDASNRARSDGRLIVVAVHAQPGFSLGNMLDQVVFMSPEVIALMEHRFVGWRWSAGRPAPFAEHDVFGLSGTTFGVGLLICTPDGRVVRQVFLVEPVLVADALRATLQEHADLAPPPPRATRTKLAQIEFLVDSGQLEAATELLGEVAGDDPVALTYQRARLHRIRRDGIAALELYRAIRDAPALAADGAPTVAEVCLEEADVLVGLGRNDAARDAIVRCLDSGPDDGTRATALLLHGALAWADGRVDETREQWTTLTRELPEQPPAWTAAAALIGPALDVETTPDLSWPSEIAERLASVPAPAANGSELEIASGLAGAIDWLLENQRSDGGWDVPFGTRRTHPAPDPVTTASQAICTLALARAAQVAGDADRAARCRDRARAGLRKYLADRALVHEHPLPVAFMDYTCWGSSYGLFCLAAVLDPALGMVDGLSKPARAEVDAEAGRLVEDLLRIQAANGGWSYYISGEVDGTSAGAAMSFTTATVLLALEAAGDRGIEVPDDALDRGRDCLASLRGKDGHWAYSRMGTGRYDAGRVGAASAAARGPVCVLALQRSGRLEDEAMAQALETYVAFLSVFGAEARKALMHAGPQGQGSHYLLYDYSTAAEALRATSAEHLDPAIRRKTRGAILRELARCRNADGSFVDNPIIGCAPGTGLATLTLLDLEADTDADPTAAPTAE